MTSNSDSFKYSNFLRIEPSKPVLLQFMEDGKNILFRSFPKFDGFERLQDARDAIDKRFGRAAAYADLGSPGQKDFGIPHREFPMFIETDGDIYRGMYDMKHDKLMVGAKPVAEDPEGMVLNITRSSPILKVDPHLLETSQLLREQGRVATYDVRDYLRMGPLELKNDLYLAGTSVVAGARPTTFLGWKNYDEISLVSIVNTGTAKQTAMFFIEDMVGKQKSMFKGNISGNTYSLSTVKDDSYNDIANSSTSFSIVPVGNHYWNPLKPNPKPINVYLLTETELQGKLMNK